MSMSCLETKKGSVTAPLIYLLKSFNEEYGYVYKIGITKNDLSERLRNLNTGNPNKITVENTYYPKVKASKLEARLHKRFSYSLVKGEWYNLTDEDVNNFIQTCEILEQALLQIEKPPY